MSYFTKRTMRIVGGTLAGALALSVSPILGFTGVASAQTEADPIGAGNFCEDVPQTENFSDITSADPAFGHIVCLVATEITVGFPDGTYRPNSSTSRRQMALFLTRLADEADRLEIGDSIEELPAYDGTPDFSDHAAEEAEQEAAIGRLNQAGIASGFPDGTYRPGAPVSRRQMATFIYNLYDFLTGAPLAASATDHFTDDNSDSAEQQTRTNAVAEAGIFIGNADGTFAPAAPITRRQMARVMTRTLQVLLEAGKINQWFAEGAGVTGTVTSTAVNPVTFDDAAGKSYSADLTADTDTGDTFFIDGVSATEAAFIAATSVGDTINVEDTDSDGNWDIHRLTNAPLPSSGVIGFVDTVNDDFAFITGAGTKLTTVQYGDAEDTYTVDGAAVSLAGFEAALSMGDTVATTDTSTPANGEPDAYALTNGTWDGAVSDIVETAGVSVSFFVRGSGDEPDNAADADPFIVRAAEVLGGTQVVTIGGAAATYQQFEDAISAGDTVVYSRAAGVERFALTNVAPPAVTGTATDAFDAVADTIVLVNGATDIPVDYTGVASYRVGGVAVIETEFEAALTPGDSVTFQPDNPDTPANEGAISLTNAALQGNVRDIDAVGNTLDVTNTVANVIADNVDYSTAYFGGQARYFVNGAEVDLTTFDNYLAKADLDATPDETIVVEDVNTAQGVDISTNYRLTTDETLP